MAVLLNILEKVFRRKKVAKPKNDASIYPMF